MDFTRTFYRPDEAGARRGITVGAKGATYEASGCPASYRESLLLVMWPFMQKPVSENPVSRDQSDPASTSAISKGSVPEYA